MLNRGHQAPKGYSPALSGTQNSCGVESPTFPYQSLLVSLPPLCLIPLGFPSAPQPCLHCLALPMAHTRYFSGEETILVPTRTFQFFSEPNMGPELPPGQEELVTRMV